MVRRFIIPGFLHSFLFQILISAYLLGVGATSIAAETLGPYESSHGRAYLHLLNVGSEHDTREAEASENRTQVEADEETSKQREQESPGSTLPAHEFLAILEIQLDEGWHTYWKNPGDSGTALQHRWKLPGGWDSPELLWPVPERIETEPLMTYGYENTVRIPFVFKTRGTGGSFRVELEWLECAEVCIPARIEIQGQMPYGNENEIADAGAEETWNKARTSLPANLENPLQGTADSQWLKLELPSASGLTDHWRTPEETYAFLDDPTIVHHAGKQKLLDQGILIPLQPGARPEKVQGILKVDGQAYSFVASVTRVDSIAESNNNSMLELLVYSGLAFLGGLILNLMPCVLPVLSLKVFHLMSLSGESRKRLFLYTGTYSVGVVLSFLALSGILIALRSAGEQLGWGFHLQSSGFLVFMILFLSLFAFNLLGVFEIGLSLTSIAAPEIKSDHGHRALGSAFLSGVLATVVASPCTAPFMGSAIGFALSQSAIVTLTVFFFLGLGLASPFLLAGIFPVTLKAFPKPGAWMVRFKQLLAFPLLATVGWLLWVLGNQTSVNGMTLALFAVLLLALASYLYGSFMQPFSHKISNYVAATLMIFFLLMAGGSGFVSASMEDDSKTIPPINAGADLPEYVPGQWMEFSPALVQRFRDANVPVFVDFTADWCLSCQVNKKTVLHTETITRLFQRTRTATIQADWTNEDPIISRELEKLGRNGVPVYALYIPGEDEPRLLPEILTVGIMEEAFEPLTNINKQQSGESQTPLP